MENRYEISNKDGPNTFQMPTYLVRFAVIIEVSNTGNGMTPEAQAKIFIPFYSTKATGSGIELSWSRQIMRLHKGAISVQSELGKGTTFPLLF